ncbi:MAG: Holliday junction branch migration protein RuvA, partial [Hominimerdicola sp.]
VTLYTHLAVKEDDVSLFGFADKEELKSFRMLISVSGVGPKAAIAILSACTPSQFALAVATGDSKAFTKVKGIGTKIAQRIVLELKDKIAKENTISVRSDGESIISAPEGGAVHEAVSALVVLGYSEGEAMSVISKLDPTLPVEELIKKALIGLAKF